MIPVLPFGRTGHTSTRTLFGAAAFSNVTQQQADDTLQTLLDFGVNHIDTAASYGDSELRIAPWMKNHRDDFFLATKTGERTYEKAKAQIDESLQRLNVGHVDLIQLHNLVDEAEWQTAMGEDGALRACVEAREAGKVRFIGVTGHGLEVARRHLQSLAKFDFDSVLLPMNYPMSLNAEYLAEFEALRSLCGERNVAMQIIKSVTRRPWGEQEQTRATWYQPLEEQSAIDTAMAWAMGNYPEAFLNTPGDINVLPRVLDAAARFDTAPDDETMEEMFAEREMAPLFV